MSSLSKNIGITFSSRLLIFALGIGASIILARLLGPTGKGIYALIILIPAVMVKFGTLGIEASNVYFTGSKKYEIKDIGSNSLVAGISLGLVLILIFWGVLHLSSFQNFISSNKINPFYLWIVVLTIPLSLVSGFLNNIILGKEEMVKYNQVNILNSAIRLVTVIFFLLVLRQGILGATLSYVFTTMIVTLFVMLLIRKMTKICFSLNPKLLRESTAYGGKAYFGSAAQFLNYRLDMFLVAFFLTPAAVGYYSITVAIAEGLWMLPGVTATVLFPRISSLQDSEANMLTPRVSRHTFFLIFISSLVLIPLAKPLIKLLFGSAFLPSVTPLLILLPGIIALGGAKTISADLAGRGKPEICTLAAFISLAINIPLNLLLIPRWGISGAAFASSVAYILSTLIVLIAFVKISNNSWSEALFIKKKDFQDYKKILKTYKSFEI